MVSTSDEALEALAFLGIAPPQEGEIQWTVRLGGEREPAGVTALDAVKVYAEEMERDEGMALRTAARLREQLRDAEARAEAYRMKTSTELLRALAILGIKPPAEGESEWTLSVAGELESVGVTPVDAVKAYAEEMERDEGMALRTAARLREELHETQARSDEAIHELIERLQSNARWFRQRGNTPHARLCELANDAIVSLSSRLQRAAA